MRAWIRSLFARPNRPVSCAPRSARLAVESLDSRVLMSVTATWNTATGAMRIDGDNLANQVSIWEQDTGSFGNSMLWLFGVSAVSVNGAAAVPISAIPTWGLRSLDVRLNGGDDSFSISLNPTAYASWAGGYVGNPLFTMLQSISVSGGADRDTIDLRRSNFAPTTIDGGTEYDTLYGGVGPDRLIGGLGGDWLSGGDGNDTLYGGLEWGTGSSDGYNVLLGGRGNDILHGGDSGNSLHGEDGNDDLYGGLGIDDLIGGAGNDGLFGGLGQDSLRGGASNVPQYLKGNDRYLVRVNEPFWAGGVLNDTTPDYNPATDAKIRFINGTDTRGVQMSFSSTEIEQIDLAFSKLVNKTQNTRLLERSRGGDQVFQRVEMILGAPPGSTILADNNNAGIIRITDSGVADVTTLGRVVVHELGHNWDSQAELTGSLDSEAWTRWLGLSGWQTWNMASAMPPGMVQATDLSGKKLSWVDGAGNTWAWMYKIFTPFAREYGRDNPADDFCTAWEAYFYADIDPGLTKVPAKQSFLDDFFHWLTGSPSW